MPDRGQRSSVFSGRRRPTWFALAFSAVNQRMDLMMTRRRCWIDLHEADTCCLQALVKKRLLIRTVGRQPRTHDHDSDDLKRLGADHEIKPLFAELALHGLAPYGRDSHGELEHFIQCDAGK